MPNFIDITGQTFNRWTVVSKAAGYGRTYWVCRCQCGTVKDVCGATLISGMSKSCGCHKAEVSHKHGRDKSDPTYQSWMHMRSRCNNTKSPIYANYGGRGITVCREWDDFLVFLADMGERPSRLYTIGRIDNDKGYSKENCRWELPKQQGNNKRTSHIITFDGKTQTLAQWADDLGLKYSTLKARIDRAYAEALQVSLEKALRR